MKAHKRPQLKSKKSIAKFRGVRRRAWGKWVSEVREPLTQARIWLGSFDTAEMAARAYDVAVLYLRGPSAMINFADSPKRLPRLAQVTAQTIRAAAASVAISSASSTSNADDDGVDVAPPVVESLALHEQILLDTPSQTSASPSASGMCCWFDDRELEFLLATVMLTPALEEDCSRDWEPPLLWSHS